MSRKNAFGASMQAVVARMGGAHLTREARERTAKKFCEIVFAAGFTHLKNPSDIKAKQIRVYVVERKREGVAIRSLQNELSHLRGILSLVGLGAMVKSDALSNKTLEVSGGSRLGTTTAITDDELERACALAFAQNRPGMAALLNIERRLGLRGNEAIHGRGDTLSRWLAELQADGRVTVMEGTKGGKSRIVTVQLIDPAILAVREAIDVAARQRDFLVVRADGSASGGLKQARSIYHSWMSRAKVRPHAARYAFARDQMRGYLASGFSLREAQLATSLDLGHGSGRGRWIKSVYLR